jgi:hypothetical protein
VADIALCCANTGCSWCHVSGTAVRGPIGTYAVPPAMHMSVCLSVCLAGPWREGGAGTFDEATGSCVVMADPEGNEFCIG